MPSPLNALTFMPGFRVRALERFECIKKKTFLRTKMLDFLYNIPFLFLEPPNLKIKKISVPVPSAKTIFFIVLLSYFLVCAGELDFLFTSVLF
jgi:hypothetical protein